MEIFRCWDSEGSLCVALLLLELRFAWEMMSYDGMVVTIAWVTMDGEARSDAVRSLLGLVCEAGAT